MSTPRNHQREGWRRLFGSIIDWLRSTWRRYPAYITCPHCQEPEIEIWEHDESVSCHHCGSSIDLTKR